MTPTTAVPPVTFAEASRVWGRIALLSFGGPAGQIALMHRLLVVERGWISEAGFLHALNFCMLLPGPEAQQLAVYIGWLMHGRRGGVMAGGLFVLPGMATLMALGWITVLWGDIGWVAGFFAGLKAAVLAVVLQALLRLGRSALRTAMARLVAVAAFVALFFLAAPFPLVLLLAAVVGWLGRPEVGATDQVPAALIWRPLLRHASGVLWLWLPLWFGPVLALWLWRGDDDLFTRLALFFSKTALVTFGGAYAVLAYVAQRAVESYHWLTPAEMLTGLGLAETTPGPLIMVVQHVGFMAGFHQPGSLPPLLAATLAGLLVTWVTFIPCFLWVFLGAPAVEALRGMPRLDAALAQVTAAVVGVIGNLALWFALHSLFRQLAPWQAYGLRLDLPRLDSLDGATAGLALFAAVGLFSGRSGVIVTLLATAVAGAVMRAAGIGGMT